MAKPRREGTKTCEGRRAQVGNLDRGGNLQEDGRRPPNSDAHCPRHSRTQGGTAMTFTVGRTYELTKTIADRLTHEGNSQRR
jgi:hypothetical protein